ncbi:N-formylglutamate amidohydrolase [Microbaculum sp. FT89]|uniref:N-formylglutamate amidohydrolase n=1 Tax=Microbaculum sp. FT89 TaxID=3447298 RepID=UPI003F5328D2
MSGAGAMNGVVEPVSVERSTDLIRREGAPTGGDFVIVCDHASNRIPPGFGELGLNDTDMRRHIAWDPGALPVARGLAGRFGGPLLYPDASRLLIDCNRPPTAADSTLTVSEDTEIPGNRGLAAELRARRIAEIYDAYHAAIDAVLEARAAEGATTAVVAVHSFTPVYRGKTRPWHIGVLYDADRRLAEPLLAALRADADLVVGDNEPYGPWDGVYHTLSRHAEARGLPCVMIEIANDRIADPDAQRAWVDRLEAALKASLGAIA